ncbi:MAG: hypothetical protein ACP5RZ_03150 [Thermoplasmata archaeon]
MNLYDRGVAPIVSEILLITISVLLVIAVIFFSMDILNGSNVNGKYYYFQFMLEENDQNLTLMAVSGNISVPFIIYVTNFQNISEKINIMDLSKSDYYLNLYGKNITMQIYSVNRYYFTGGDYISFINMFSQLNQGQIISLHLMIIIHNQIIINEVL